MKEISRREFLRLGGITTLGFIIGCRPTEEVVPQPTAVWTSVSVPTVFPTETAIPRENPIVLSKEIPTETPVPTPTETPIPPDCITVNPNEQKIAANEFEKSYPDWKKRYVVPAGATELKVIRPEDNNDTVSEGMAYGMIFSVHADDKNTFDGLWKFTKSHFNKNGVMSWRVEANGSIPDRNSATDAELDMAYSLMVADKKWGGYKQEAIQLINTLMEHCVEKGTFVLKPGDGWGGSDTTNPSYFSPAYFEMFQRYTWDERWDKVAEASRKIIDAVHTKRPQSAQTGLLPNWTKADGSPVPHMGELSDKYVYDATRVPLRQAMAALWFCDKPEIADHAASQLKNLNFFFEKIGPAKIVDGYALDGTPVGQYHNAAFIAPAAIASLVSTNDEYRRSILDETVKAIDGRYYNDSLRIFSLLFLSGKMQMP